MIAVADLRLSFGERAVLSGVDLRVSKGEILTVMGISGGGKTSLLKCMAGLLRPTSGNITINEVDLVTLTEPELNQRRRRLGMVFQYAALFDSLTVYENVVFGLRMHERHTESELRGIAREQLSAVGMEEAEDLLPAQLSGGMRKRVGLARALAVQPEVVFYDEPTSGLDPVVARVIDDLIVRTRDRLGVTSVIVSHDVPSVMRTADRAALLHEGRIIACDVPAALRESQHPVVRQFIEGRADGPIQVVD